MNGFKTVMLLAAMTALFMGLGYGLGGSGGALVALVFAAGMNLFTFWNADKIVLRMHDAPGAAPNSSAWCTISLPARGCRCRASM